MPEFKDHFSALAHDYASYRPRYPLSLFADLAAVAPGRTLAWDCATGNGQATGPGNVRFAVAPAEACGLAAGTVDLVLVAQAAHWFDLPAFYAEAERVLRPGGVLALLTYSGVHVSADLDPLLREFHEVTVGPWWPPERAYVESGYRDLPFPWPEIPFPAQTMTADWTLEQLLGYLGTWSATARYREAVGSDPLPALRAHLLPLWGRPETVRTVRWPLPVRIGRRP